MRRELNVLGEPLHTCCDNPKTGFFRTGRCETSEMDTGSHTVCIHVTDAFLIFSQTMGNDLSTPAPQFGFSGLRPGDQWCLCAPRWQEALEAGMAPPIILEACHESALQYVSLEDLKLHALATTGHE